MVWSLYLLMRWVTINDNPFMNMHDSISLPCQLLLHFLTIAIIFVIVCKTYWDHHPFLI